MTFIIIVLLIIGAAILGSFFNVLIYRLPREESIIWPPSHCPRCNRPIRPHENIPIVSFVFLHGKCRGCNKPISPLYPAVEATTIAATIVLWFFLLQPVYLSGAHGIACIPPTLFCLVLLFLIPVAVIDWRHYIIHDFFSLGALVLGVGVAFVPGGLTPLDALIGMLVGGGTLGLSGLVAEWVFKKKEAMGGGDIKLMAAIGALWGWNVALLSIILGAFVGTLAGLTLLGMRKLDNEHRIAFGPFLTIGIWISVLFGKEIIAVYTRWFLIY